MATPSPQSVLPKSARAVVIGGGVAGCSVAYHLAALGWKDVVLLERKQLTSGTTWHAAGLIAQGRASPSMMKICRYSGDLYDRIEAETGLSTGFKRNGSLYIAITNERAEEVKRLAASVAMNGYPAELISIKEAKDIYPLLELSDATAALWYPRDGQADPANVALAMAKGARLKGAKIFENVKVTGIATSEDSHGRRKVVGVSTDQGTIQTDIVVNCAGLWAREVGKMVGAAVPLQACEHFYIVTEPIDGIHKQLPVMRVQEECAYYKEDAGKILLGCFEPKAKPWAVNGVPDDFAFGELPDDFDHFQPILEMAMKRIPALQTASIRKFFNGPESFTPDDRWQMGETPECRGHWVLAGFNSVGIVSSGGAGWALAEWMDQGAPSFDLGEVDVRRNHSFQNTKHYVVERATETLGLLYAHHWPYRQFETSRGVRHSALHERMAALGACFGEAAGWERPNWFLPKAAASRGEKAEYQYSWQRQNWFPYAAAEHKAIREGVGFFDMTSFGKIRVEGRDAEAVLQRVCANDVDVGVGRIVYTQWLNGKGGVEADVTVTRLSNALYLVVTPSMTLPRDLAWLQAHIPDDAQCIATDVTALETVIPVMGPKARDVLKQIVDADLSNDAFPFGTAQTVEIGMAPVRAHRVTYVGELGWELYVSNDMARHVFDRLWAAGEPMGLTPCGLHVLDSCRLEKAFRHQGHDISDADHVLEAGLGFAVKTGKANGKYGAFVGCEAVVRKKEQGLSRRMVQFQLKDPAPLLYHHEPIYRDGKLTGYTTSANYGHHLGGAVALGYVECSPKETAADVMKSTFEIDVAGKRMAAKASLKPLYDPEAVKVRA